MGLQVLRYFMVLYSLVAVPLSFGETLNTDQKEGKEKKRMSISGKFEVKLEPQKDDIAPAGRMLINKTYSGALTGVGIGQMISKRTDTGVAVYSAIEEFSGSVDGKEGAFTLLHKGHMSSESQSLEVQIIPGSGSGALTNISGSMTIEQSEGQHRYVLSYAL